MVECSQNSAAVPKGYFRRILFNLKLAGLILDNNQVKSTTASVMYVIYSALILILVVYSYTVTELIYVLKNYDNPKDLCFGLSYFIAHVIGTAKVTLMIYKRKSIALFLKTLDEGSFLPSLHRGGQKEFDLIKDAVLKVKIQIIIYSTIITIMLSNRMIWILMNPTTEDFSLTTPNATITLKQFPFANAYPFEFDSQKSPNYELVFVHQILGVWGFGWYFANMDILTGGIMIHLSAQFRIVANSFVYAAESAKKSIKERRNKKASRNDGRLRAIDHELEYDNAFLDCFKRRLKRCIEHHQNTLSLAEGMENTFSLMFLVQFVGCFSLYGMQLYQLSLISIHSTLFLSMTFFMFGMIFQFLIYCWNGNEVSVASEEVAHAAFCSAWVPADKSTKALLITTITRAQRPVCLTAGKFSKLSLATFAAVLRGSFSYFTVLKNMNTLE